MWASGKSVIIRDAKASYASGLSQVLFADGIFEVNIFHQSESAERWIAMNTLDMAIIDPELRDGACHGLVSTLVKRMVPYIVHSEFRPSAGSWLTDGQWVRKSCSRDAILAAVRLAISLRQIHMAANDLSADFLLVQRTL